MGKFTSVDPYRQYSSGYTGIGNNPINWIDPDGGCVLENGEYCENGNEVGQILFEGNYLWEWDGAEWLGVNNLSNDFFTFGDFTVSDSWTAQDELNYIINNSTYELDVGFGLSTSFKLFTGFAYDADVLSLTQRQIQVHSKFLILEVLMVGK